MASDSSEDLQLPDLDSVASCRSCFDKDSDEDCDERPVVSASLPDLSDDDSDEDSDESDLPDLSDDDCVGSSVESIPAFLDGSLRDDIVELFSPPRMVSRCARFGLRGSLSMDILTGYDFSRAEDRHRARWDIARRRPRFVMTCPPCTFYSTLQVLWNKKKVPRLVWLQRERYANVLLTFALKICQDQIDTGDLYGFEHPRFATSWQTPVVKELSSLDTTHCAYFDMCRFNARTKVEQTPTKKATSLMTNMPALFMALDGCTCRCREVHRPLHSSEGGMTRCRWASIYTAEFCDAVLAVLAANR